MLSLDRSGYYIGVAQQAAPRKRRTAARNIRALDRDNLQFSTAVRMLLKLEGYEPRVASNRDEIVAALRTRLPTRSCWTSTCPAPTVSISWRASGSTRAQGDPVIMLTAQTSRKDVLRGLAEGQRLYHQALRSRGPGEEPARGARTHGPAGVERAVWTQVSRAVTSADPASPAPLDALAVDAQVSAAHARCRAHLDHVRRGSNQNSTSSRTSSACW